MGVVKRTIAMALVAAGAFVSVPSAVQDPPPTFIRSSTELVLLPATVVDRRGAFVSGLPRERFAVFDNDRRQEVALFDNSDTPVTVGLIVDTSSSMGPKLPEVSAAALVLAGASNPDDEFFMIDFGDKVRTPEPELLTFNKLRFETILQRLVARGRTALYDGLLAGLVRMKDVGRTRKALVVISDGADNASTHTLDDVLLEARRSNVTLFTIGLFSEDDKDRNPAVLQSLAESTGGQRFLPKTPLLLMAACETIARELRSGYLLGYTPPDRDGAFHRVRITLERGSGGNMSVRTRPGYFASEAPK